MKLKKQIGQTKHKKKLTNIVTKLVAVCAGLIVISMVILQNNSFAKDDKDKRDVESEFLTSIDMVIDILEKDKDISDYANTYKYIYYKYTDDEDYKTELDFSAYDMSDYSSISNSSNYEGKNIASGVLALRERILKEAKKCGIKDYIDVLLALVMQESGGSSGNPDYATNYDVFQSSESKGLPPNTLNTEESIKQGVAYFAGQLKKCNYDVDFALQAYNFGGGFITYAKPKGGYSKENANNFAKQQSKGRKRDPNSSMAKNAGIWAYGDQNYVEHVRQYLTETEKRENGNIIVDTALKYVGNPYVWGGSSLTNGCDCSHFVWLVLKEVGAIPKNASYLNTSGIMTNAQSGWKCKKIGTAANKAEPGDIIIYRPGNIHHAAIYIGDGKIVEAQSSKAGITSNRTLTHEPIAGIFRPTM